MRKPFHVRIIQMDDANVLSPPIVFRPERAPENATLLLMHKQCASRAGA